MKTILYYAILVILCATSMVLTSFVLGELVGYDAIGVKGSVAGMGLVVIYGRKSIFNFFDKIFKVKAKDDSEKK